MGKPTGELMAGRSNLPAGQLRAELDWLIALFKREGVRSYLEIGARSGDTFWEIVNSLPQGSKAVAVDLPGSTWGYGGSEGALQRTVTDLCNIGYDAHVVIGNSHDYSTRNSVRRHGKFDAVLVDGDHTLAGVSQDWADYGVLGRLTAFHDIAWKRDVFPGTRIEVPEFWSKIKVGYRTEEIVTEPRDCGIGVMWNY